MRDGGAPVGVASATGLRTITDAAPAGTVSLPVIDAPANKSHSHGTSPGPAPRPLQAPKADSPQTPIVTHHIASPRRVAQAPPEAAPEYGPQPFKAPANQNEQSQQDLIGPPARFQDFGNIGPPPLRTVAPTAPQEEEPSATPPEAAPATSPDDGPAPGEEIENSKLRFLRSQTVLLQPGEFQFDVSMQYVDDKFDYLTVQNTNGLTQIAETEQRQRLLLVPLQLRFGVCEFTQAFVNVPFGWADSEVSFLGADTHNDQGGIGDVSAGIVKQIIVGNDYYPSVLTTFAFSSPTGDQEFETVLAAPGSTLGEGFWSASAGLTFLQDYDPLVLFYGGGFRYRFQRKFDGLYQVDPGNQFYYRMGIGFAVNPNLTLSASYDGSFISEAEINGEDVGGSVREPMHIRLAATINRRDLSCSHASVKTIEPFVAFGLNDDAIDTLLGISWTH
ncbi:MAG: hypothetical protein AB7I48_15650 [Planctomycetaceae bacterium]